MELLAFSVIQNRSKNYSVKHVFTQIHAFIYAKPLINTLCVLQVFLPAFLFAQLMLWSTLLCNIRVTPLHKLIQKRRNKSALYYWIINHCLKK
jgi:hypothetical protein